MPMGLIIIKATICALEYLLFEFISILFNSWDLR
jgi:hypothetical protein